MKKEILLLFWGIFCSLMSAPALADQGDLFEEANRLFSENEFARAAALYEKITAESGFSAAVLFNLANSYAELGQTGKAVVYYERAALLTPGDPDINANLSKLRKEQGLFSEPKKGIAGLLKQLPINQWVWLLPAGLLLAALATTAALRKWPAKGFIRGVACLCFVFIVAGAAGVYSSLITSNPAIVIAQDARLLLSPFPTAAPVGKVQEGRKLRVIKEHGDYFLVDDATRRKGWLRQDHTEFVIPAKRSQP